MYNLYKKLKYLYSKYFRIQCFTNPIVFQFLSVQINQIFIGKIKELRLKLKIIMKVLNVLLNFELVQNLQKNKYM